MFYFINCRGNFYLLSDTVEEKKVVEKLEFFKKTEETSLPSIKDENILKEKLSVNEEVGKSHSPKNG